jgi:hypothetical protein
MELELGDLIVVLEAPEGGWWRGMKNLGGKEAKTGWFPATMVSLVQTDEDKKVKSSQGTLSSIQGSSHSLKSKDTINTDTSSMGGTTQKDLHQLSSADSMGSSSSLSSGDKKKWYNRLVKKPSKDDKENKKSRLRSLSAPSGPPPVQTTGLARQLSDATEFDEDDVQSGQNDSGSRLPSPESNNHLAAVPEPVVPEVKPKNVRPLTLFSSHKRSVSAPTLPPILSIYGGFQTERIEEVDSKSRLSIFTPSPESPSDKAWHERLSPEVLSSLSQKERHRMTAIWELITTERDYVRDLKIIIHVSE